MAFVVTITTTKGNVDDPDWGTWISSLDEDYLSNEYPDLAGITPQQYCNSFQTDVVEDVSEGFVSEENSFNPDTGVSVFVSTWESEAAWKNSLVRQNIAKPTNTLTGNINANIDSPVVTGISTKFLTEIDPGDTVRGPLNGNVEVLGTVASVETDTQLTLVANANFSVIDRRYSVFNQSSDFSESAMQWLGRQYINLYPSTMETTYANV